MIDNDPILDFLLSGSDNMNPHPAQFQGFLHRFFNSIPLMVCLSDIKDGRIKYVNQLFLDSFEFSKDTLIGKALKELRIVENKKDFKRTANLVLEKGFIRNTEIRLRTSTGRIMTTLYSGDVIRHGGARYLFSFIMDITEKKNMELRLAAVERLKLMGELAASIGHEIRNPLNTVYGFLQLNKLKGYCEFSKDDFELMISELQRANNIIDEFLYLSKEKTFNMVKHNLTRILFRIAPLIKTEAARNRKFVKIELSTVPDLMLDESEIRQLVFNMVRNGLEAMEEEKCLTLKTYERDGKVILMVKDEGTGIDNEVLEKLGSPFFTTKENGVGMGLSNCYGIARRHNADISIDTGPDGTTFSVIFNPGQSG